MRARARLGRTGGRLLAVIASVGVTLLLFEGGLRLAGLSPLYDVYSKPSLFWRYDALLGWSCQPGSSGRYVGPRPWPVEFDAEVRINSVGLRGPEIGPKPPGGYRILVLGDSVVAGFEVEWEETFVAVAEKRLNRRFPFPVEVLNAGVRGYGTDQNLLYYRERGHRLEADLVVLVHSGNDPRNNVTLHRMARPFGKGAFRPRDDDSLELLGTPVPRYPLCTSVGLDDAYQVVRRDRLYERALCFLETRLSDHSALFARLAVGLRSHPELLRFLHQGIGQTDSAPGRRSAPHLASALPWGRLEPGAALASSATQYALTSRIMVALAQEVRNRGARFLVVVKPQTWERMDRAHLERVGVRPVYLQGPSPISREQMQFRHDSHYNAHGHRFWANVLTPELTRVIAASAPSRLGAPAP